MIQTTSSKTFAKEFSSPHNVTQCCQQFSKYANVGSAFCLNTSFAYFPEKKREEKREQEL